MFTAITLKCQVTIVMPPNCTKRFQQLLCSEIFLGTKGIGRVWQALSNVYLENAEASVEADRVSILNLIETEYHEFETLNSCVTQYMRTWLLEASAQYAQELLKGDQEQRLNGVQVCVNVWWMLLRNGLWQASLCVLERTHEAVLDLGLAGSIHEARVHSRYCYHTVDGCGDGFDGVIQAWNIVKKLPPLDTVDGAITLSFIARGITFFLESSHIPKYAEMAAETSSRIGSPLAEVAETCFVNCKNILLAKDCWGDFCSLVLTHWVILRLLQRDFLAAESYAEEAWKVQLEIGFKSFDDLQIAVLNCRVPLNLQTPHLHRAQERLTAVVEAMQTARHGARDTTGSMIEAMNARLEETFAGTSEHCSGSENIKFSVSE